MDSEKRWQFKLLFLLAKNLETQSHIIRQQALLKRKEAELHRRKSKLLCSILLAKYTRISSRNVWKLPRRSTFWEKEVKNFSEDTFRRNFRVSRATFKLLVDSLGVLVKEDTNMRSSIPLDKRIAVALYAIGSCSEYRTVGNLFGVGRTTVGVLVNEFCDAVWCTFRRKYMNTFPANEEKLREIVKGFESKWGFPQCFGALDSCHIEIRPAREYADDFYNDKGWYSMVLLACVDHRHRFTYISIGAAGGNTVSDIYKQSSLKNEMEEKDLYKENEKLISGVAVPVFLLGDSAFKMSRHLMKPYPFSVDLSDQQVYFNKQISRTRSVVENVFEQLKARFPKIGKGFETSILNARKIIKTCCMLHNICNVHNDPVDPQWLQDYHNNQSTAREQPESTTTIGDSDNGANEIRTALANFFNTKQLLM